MIDWVQAGTTIASSSSMLGVIGIIYKLGKYSQDFSHFKDTVKKQETLINSAVVDIISLKTLDKRITRLEDNWDEKLKNEMIQKKSPLSLTPYAERVLQEIKFDRIFLKIKDDLLKELEDCKLRTAYDVQEMARFIVRRKRDDVLFDELKTEVYKSGNNLDEVIAAIFIPLRDYYLERHPEIKPDSD